MKSALSILLLCAACSSTGGHAKRPTYPPGHTITETILRSDTTPPTWEQWRWQQERDTHPAGRTIEIYRAHDTL